MIFFKENNFFRLDMHNKRYDITLNIKILLALDTD